MMMWPFCPGSAACFDAARDAMNAHRVLVFFSDDTPDVDPTQYHPTEASIFAVTLVGDAESHLTREHPYRIPTSLARGRTSEGSKNNSPLVMRAVSLAEAHLRQSLLSLGAPCRGCGGRPDPGATLTSYCAGNGKPPNHCSVTVRAVPSCTQAKCRAAADRKLRSWAKTDECLWDNCRKKVRYPCSYGNCKSDEPASQRCSVCRMARYCSRECQIADYPAHKSSCSRLEKGKDDKENAGGNRERSSGMERMGGLLGALPPSVPNLSAGSPAQVQGIRAPAAVSALVGSMASSPLFAQSGSRKFLLGGSQLLGLPMEELLAFEARVEQQLPVAADDLAYLAGFARSGLPGLPGVCLIVALVNSACSGTTFKHRWLVWRSGRTWHAATRTSSSPRGWRRRTSPATSRP
ncbi:hypothetical protein DFJ74DRAFT_401314 [Hyaloraphidium curvatum]|nr:hypothetical protein DFJ74DRAFT_401314 [Hyaloraphidium curvatum]